ncbi:MAG: NTP transferase domain-containing protein [Lachnospiraceae bacterium]|nr:NTP transferase domain-containing protein [Lachnospiraceae bacterium]
MQLSKYTIDSKSNIIAAMEKIDKNSIGMIYVVEHNVVLGVITDGDIRRYLIGDGNLDSNVLEIANRDFICLQEHEICKAKEIMEQNGIRSVPILNAEREIVNICFRDEVKIEEKTQIDVPVVIMAGGKGTRLKPFTDILPKPLIPIGDKTVTERIMDHFHEYGCDKIYMIVNYKKDFIKAYFSDSIYKEYISFIDEEEFLGTGGGLTLLTGKVETAFFLSNCDIIIDADYSDIWAYHCNQNNAITMVCAEKEFSIPYGTVEIDENARVRGLVEKPTSTYLVNTGLYLVEPEITEQIPSNTYIHITDIIQNCIRDGKRVGTYVVKEDKWMDMGQFEEMEKMKRKLGI